MIKMSIKCGFVNNQNPTESVSLQKPKWDRDYG